MSENFARIAFARLSDKLPDNTVQFFDGYFARLPGNKYTIKVSHELKGAPENTQPKYSKVQEFTVRAPEFTIDPTTVMQAYPASGASDIYDQRLPFLVLADPGLPWERSLVPGSEPPTIGNPLPWLALVLFAEGEVELKGATNSPVATTQVSDLLKVDPKSQTLKPTLPADWVSPELMQSQCKTVTIPGATFNAVMPLTSELPFLAHCRAINSPHEDQLLHSVLLANRLPVADTATKPATPRRYFAHLVSLEGFADYLGGAKNPKPIPTKPGSKELMDVQMVSLYSWTFVSMPETFLSFEELVKKLIASESTTQGALRLPTASGLPPAAESRLQDGYVALKFVAGTGDETFSWYRGPFSPVVPQALPPVGPPPGVPVAQATSADALMIYLAEQGLFDMSYAAAWNIGRNLALADAHFAQAINRYVHAARTAVATIAQRLALPHFADEQDPRKLLARDASRRYFAELVGDGLGQQWTEALARARRGAPPAPASPRSRVRVRPTLHARQLWSRPETAAAVSEHVVEQLDPVADWLANLGLLYPVPFSQLVPDPWLLPVESIRFFYVDPDWIDALKAGACSIALHSSADVAAFRALHPHLTRAVAERTEQRFARRYDGVTQAGAGPGRIKMSGMLIRSELVSSWPALVVAATLSGNPVCLPRNDCPSKNVRLCLFDGIPDTVTLAEPYQGLLFGLDEDNGIEVRRVSGDATRIGELIGTSIPPNGYTGFLTTYCRTPSGGVIKIKDLASALGDATGVKVGSGFGAGDFAIQMVRAPEKQSFPSV